MDSPLCFVVYCKSENFYYTVNRMFNLKTFRTAVLSIFLCIFVASYVYVCNRELKECMGVAILPDTTEYTEYVYEDFADHITHFGTPAAVDKTTNTIYISQNFDKNTEYVDFEGALWLDKAGYTMYFAPDEKFADIASAAAEGHPFRLIVTDGSHRYMEYSVVFTSLPVISIKGELSYLRDSEEEGGLPTEIFAGNMDVWTPYDKEVMAYSTKSSALEWHVRGHSAALHDKKPWKLALKDNNGENSNLNLFGLGADDDWIVNAIAYDHTRIREKLFIGLWNEMAEETDYNTKMNDGQYAEVIMNGEYQGLYLVQRRIDDKWLGLSEHDILLKGARTYEPQYVYKAYNIVHTNLDHDYVYLLMENIFNRSDMTSFDVNNFIDTNLFIQFAYARDNRLYNNTYFTLYSGVNGYRTVMTMWDTDISFGKASVSVYNLDSTVYTPMEREDTDAIRAIYPEYDKMALERWQYLRSTVLTEENIAAHTDRIMGEITRTGSLARDHAKWNITSEDSDNLEGLNSFIELRLPWLDDLFAQAAQ